MITSDTIVIISPKGEIITKRGCIAEAFYGVSDELKAECEKRLPDALADVLRKLHAKRKTN